MRNGCIGTLETQWVYSSGLVVVSARTNKVIIIKESTPNRKTEELLAVKSTPNRKTDELLAVLIFPEK